MQNLWPILWIIGGAGLSGVAVALFYRAKIRQEVERATAVFEPERAVAHERIRQLETQLQRNAAFAEKQNSELAGLRDALRAESDKRSAAEQRNTRLPTLEATQDYYSSVLLLLSKMMSRERKG